MNNSYSHLLDRLDDFIRKYYRTKWVLGLLYLFCAAIGLFIVFSSLEYFGYYGKLARLILLISFFLVVLWISIQYFLLPFLAYNRLGKRLNYAGASKIIGDHFPTIQDKLLNALQLSEMGHNSAYDPSIIEASIEQRVKSFSSIPFYAAIDQTKNRTFFRALLALVGLMILILLVYPSLLLQGSNRILRFETEYAPPAPFEFLLENSDLTGLKNGNYVLNVRVRGSVLPSEIMMETGSLQLPCSRLSATEFSYTFQNLQSDIPFRLYGSGFYSSPYLLRVHPSPKVLRFSAGLHYPPYLHKSDNISENTGDLVVPEGTEINWHFQTLSSDSLEFLIPGKTTRLSPVSGGFSYQEKAGNDFEYTFVPINAFIKKPDSFHYSVKVIRDLSPQIEVSRQDSAKSDSRIRFSGQIQDDYGFSRLEFHYSYPQSDNLGVKNGKTESFSIPIPFSKTLTTQPFSMVLDLDFLAAAKGKEITCYFEVWDNDGVHGPKSSRTEAGSLYLLSKQEDMAKKSEMEKSAESDLKKAIGQAKKLESDAKSLMEKVQTSNSLSFEQRESIHDILNEKKNLDSTLSKINKENAKAENNTEPSQNPFLQKKEEDMKSLLDSLLSKESKDLLDKLSKMLDENKIRETKQLMRNFNDQNKSLSNELKRAEELYKQLERDREIQNMVDLLHEMAKKEKDLSQNSEKGKTPTDEIKKLESEQQKNFNDLKKQLGDLEKTNNKDKVNPDFTNPQEMEQEISKSQEETQNALSKQDRKSASSSQKKTSSHMDELGFKLSKMKQSLDAQELDLDLHAIRLILQNLLRVSYKQESLMQGLHNTSPNDPSIVGYIQQQFTLKEAIGHVQDSLHALSMKVPAIQSFVTKEMGLVNTNMEQLTQMLADRRFYEAQVRQQYVMTSINNLAVILSNIEKQMAMALAGMKGMGTKPGNNSSIGPLISRQNLLNQQIGQTGQGLSGNEERDNEALVKMASEQAAIRQALEKLRNKAESRGKLAGDLGKIEKEMEESETDLLHKRIKPENSFRQKEILTRMLEAEKAEKEQGMEQKFQSSSGKDYGTAKIKSIATFLPEKNSEIEVLKSLSPSINTYFKMKINTYFNLLNDSQSRNEKLGAH